MGIFYTAVIDLVNISSVIVAKDDKINNYEHCDYCKCIDVRHYY